MAAQYHVDVEHTRHVGALALGMFDELARARPARRRPARARAAVGGLHAARHRHVDRLRRPPQALALPDPQRRPAGLRAGRDRDHRPGRPLPPQGHARAGADGARCSARATPSGWTAARCCCAWPRTSSARATSSCAAPRIELERRRGRAAADRRGRVRRCRAGRPGASASCSRAPSTASCRSPPERRLASARPAASCAFAPGAVEQRRGRRGRARGCATREGASSVQARSTAWVARLPPRVEYSPPSST